MFISFMFGLSITKYRAADGDLVTAIKQYRNEMQQYCFDKEYKDVEFFCTSYHTLDIVLHNHGE